jgi:uncharacterized membrane protein
MSDVSPAPRRSRFWLIVSLCLNFFLIGLVVAGIVVARNRMIAGAVGGGEGNLPEVIVQLLPPSGAVKMCRVIAANTEAFRKLGRDLIDARRDVFRAFRADPFDAAVFKRAVDRTTVVQISLVQLRQSVGVQVTEQLDASERRELARKLVQRFFSGARRDEQRHASLRDACAAAGTAPR